MLHRPRGKSRLNNATCFIRQVEVANQWIGFSITLVSLPWPQKNLVVLGDLIPVQGKISILQLGYLVEIEVVCQLVLKPTLQEQVESNWKISNVHLSRTWETVDLFPFLS